MEHSALTNLLHRQPHVVGFVQFWVALDGARSSNPTAEQRACQLALGVAVSPARQSRLGALRHFGAVLGRRGEQVNIAKFVVESVHGVHAVNQHLHLSAHLVVVDGGGPAHHVGLKHLLHDGIGIVVNNAAAKLLAGQTTSAKGDVFVRKCNFCYLVSGSACTFGKLVGQHVAV